MRNVACKTLMTLSADPSFVFLTADSGYGVLEPLQEALGERFINAGLAEQNMVGTAAGLARDGLNPWVYSLGPYMHARPYEQIRNDVCQQNLPVKLVGDGQSSSRHHAAHDYGALLCFKNIRAYVPAFDDDVSEAINAMNESPNPSYLRLGRCEKPAGFTLPRYAPWRQLISGDGPVVMAVGPVAGSYIDAFAKLPDWERPNFWVVTELPIEPRTMPTRFRCQLRTSQALMVAEDHVAQGGAGQMLTHTLFAIGETVPRFAHCCADDIAGLDVSTVLKRLHTLSRS